MTDRSERRPVLLFVQDDSPEDVLDYSESSESLVVPEISKPSIFVITS